MKKHGQKHVIQVIPSEDTMMEVIVKAVGATGEIRSMDHLFVTHWLHDDLQKAIHWVIMESMKDYHIRADNAIVRMVVDVAFPDHRVGTGE